MITEEFQDVFYGKPVWCKGALHEGERWLDCLESEKFFLDETNYTNVPEELRRLMYKALNNVQQAVQIRDRY